jgi:DNA-directed RNA polymerase subunit RPC12/RpoP
MRIGDRWSKRIVRDSRQADLLAGRPIRDQDFVNSEFLESLQVSQENRCYHCGIFMDWIKRNHRPGLTLERLDNEQAHHKNVCVLACKSCNSRKLSKEKSMLLRYFRKWYRATFDVRPQFIKDNRRCTFAT